MSSVGDEFEVAVNEGASASQWDVSSSTTMNESLPSTSADLFFWDVASTDDDSDTLYAPGTTSCEVSASGDYPSGVSSCNEEIEEDEIIRLEADDLSDVDIPVSYRNALVLNEGYQMRIQTTVNLLDEQLMLNLTRQREMETEIFALHRGTKSAEAREYLKKGPKNSLGVFSYPYFKDCRGFTHPPNADTVKKRGGDEPDVYLTRPKEWTREDLEKLSRLVREDALRNRSRPLLDKQKSLLSKIKNSEATDAEKKDLAKEKKSLDRDIKSLANLSDSVLHSDRNEEHDWMRISQAFQSHISPRSCELMWKNSLHPSINVGPWTADEDALLRDLAEESGLTRWDAVAEELRTNRTGFLCFTRYQQNLDKATAEKGLWTEKDDERLFHVVERCRTENLINWSKVSYYMNGKTKEQCSQRYGQSVRLDLKKGTFSEEEDHVIMVGVWLFGESSWAKIADYLPHRTPSQLHSRYQNFLKADLHTWSNEENRHLLELVKKHGNANWAAVASELGGIKTKVQCRTQFAAIYKAFMKKSSDFNLTLLRPRTTQQRRRQERKRKLEDALEEYFVQQERERASEASPGIEKVDLFGYYITSKGIPQQDLLDFVLTIRSRIPQVAKAAPRSTPSARVGMIEAGAANAARRQRGRPLKGALKPKPGSKVERCNRELTEYFRPTWVNKCGRPKTFFTDGELKDLSDCSSRIAKALKFDPKELTDERLQSMDAKDQQVAGALLSSLNRDQAESNGNSKADLHVFKKPLLKTYASKSKAPSPTANHTAEESASRCDALLPPNHATLVGIRALTLHVAQLPDLAKSSVSRRDTNATLMNGVLPSLMAFSAKNNGQDDGAAVSAEERRAEELLFQRMKCLFTLPSFMSGIAMAEGDSLFLESDSHVAARRPFDVSEIINQVQEAPRPTKRLRVVRKTSTGAKTKK